MNKVLIGIIAVIVIAGVALLVLGMNDEMTAENTEPTNGTELTNSNNNNEGLGGNNSEGEQVAEVPAILLAENNTGNSVEVATVTLTEPGFVAIYRMNSQSDVDLIGVTDLLEGGTYTDLTIQIDGVVAQDQVISGVVFVDDGNGEFDIPDSDYYASVSYEVVTDVDVIDTDPEDESEELLEQAKEYIEDNTDVEYTEE